MQGIRSIVKNLGLEELSELNNDLATGGNKLRSIVRERLSEITGSGSTCAVCMNTLSTQRATYTLIFGPRDFQKKGRFCGIDCLEYFIQTLKEIRRKTREMGRESKGEQQNKN